MTQTTDNLIATAILGIGCHLPKKALTNKELETMVDTNDEWILSRTGIRERRIAGEGETTASLGVEAAKQAIEDAGITAEEIELIIVATATPEMMFPSTAAFVQKGLGVCDSHAACFDLSSACSGFVYASNVAINFIRCGMYKYVLVVGSETMSRIVDYTDRNTCILFGDGAGAVVYGPSKGRREFIGGFMAADGSDYNALNLQSPGSRHPISHEILDKRMNYLAMQGKVVYKFAVNAMTRMLRDCMEKYKLTPDDFGLIIPHQANFRIIEAVSRRTDIPVDRMYMNLEKYGNTSSASVPIAIREATDEGRIPEGKYVFLCAFGGGLTWGSMLMKW